MDLARARRTRWGGIGDTSLPLAFAVLIILGGLVSVAPASAMACERATAPKGTTLIPLTAVMVERRGDALTLRLQTGRPGRCSATVLHPPARHLSDPAGGP